MWTEPTEIDNIINIFIYETGGVKIMPFMSSLFVLFVFNQTSDFVWGRFALFLCLQLRFSASASLLLFIFMVSKDSRIIYGSIFSHNKIFCDFFHSQLNESLLVLKIEFELNYSLAGLIGFVEKLFFTPKLKATRQWKREEKKNCSVVGLM